MKGFLIKTFLWGVSMIGNIVIFCMPEEIKGLPEGAAVCLYVAGWIWLLGNLAYIIFICATWGEESVRGFVRSWRIERELKKQEAAPPESLDASDGETAEVTPSPAYVLPQQNWKTICDQVHNCGGELLPDMEKELWGKEFLREAIREYLSRKYQAKIEDLKIRFIVQNKKPGLKVFYTRNKIVEREKTFFRKKQSAKTRTRS